MCASGVDFWSEVGPHSEQVDLMVEPSQVQKVKPIHFNFCHSYDIFFKYLLIVQNKNIITICLQIARVTAYLRNSGIEYQV